MVFATKSKQPKNAGTMPSNKSHSQAAGGRLKDRKVNGTQTKPAKEGKDVARTTRGGAATS